jgi:hypothetical protein
VFERDAADVDTLTTSSTSIVTSAAMPSGSYEVMAKLQASRGSVLVGDGGVSCELRSVGRASALDTAEVAPQQAAAGSSYADTLTLGAGVTLAPGEQLRVSCTGAADGIVDITAAKLLVREVGVLTVSEVGA